MHPAKASTHPWREPMRFSGKRWPAAAARLLVAAAFSAVASAQDAGTAPLERVAAAIQAWNGRDPGALFKAVKAANPDKAAIVSMRELNKAAARVKLSPRAAFQYSLSGVRPAGLGGCR